MSIGVGAGIGVGSVSGNGVSSLGGVWMVMPRANASAVPGAQNQSLRQNQVTATITALAMSPSANA